MNSVTDWETFQYKRLRILHVLEQEADGDVLKERCCDENVVLYMNREK